MRPTPGTATTMPNVPALAIGAKSTSLETAGKGEAQMVQLLDLVERMEEALQTVTTDDHAEVKKEGREKEKTDIVEETSPNVWRTPRQVPL